MTDRTGDGVLFLCVANSARSQMAEGLARKLAPPGTAIFSAGSQPSTPNPYAVRAMAEIDIDISSHTSKSVDDVPRDQVGTVITLCADEVCPAYLGAANRHHWPFEDPGTGDSPEEIAASFRTVRDAIEARLTEWLSPAILKDPRLDWPLLDANGFDRVRFCSDVSRIAAGELDGQSALYTGPIEPVDDVIDVQWSDTGEPARLRALGEDALRAGKVAAVVLNGGMATRFGNVVKGTVEVYGGKSFLALKCEDVRRAGETFARPVPLVLMNSFATTPGTDAHIAEHDRFGLADKDLLAFEQTISIRMNPDGSLFVGDDDQPSYHAPGHGDFFGCIRSSGVLKALRDRGIEVILFSNVDNLGATIDPTIIGHHIDAGVGMTAELTAKQRTASGAWDKGGAPCVAGGRRQLMEGFRFPADMAPTHLPDFSTNNFIFSAAAIDRAIPLARHVVQKTVDARPALQLESITCEGSAVDVDGQPVLNLQLLRVPRDGVQGRFFPVKERIDLDALRAPLQARLETGWNQRDGQG